MQYQKNSSDPDFGCSKSAARSAGSERMDRRHHQRFAVQATARFTWMDEGGVRRQGKGFTRDISETGIFVRTHDCPPSGVTVRLEVRASGLSTSGLMMQTRGQVVRVDSGEQAAAAAGFAAATRSLKLRDCKPSVTDRIQEYRSGPEASTQSWSDSSRKPN
jgi:PilZ domain-containing protein